MSNLLESFVGYADGASRSSRNLSSAAWAIFDPSGELVSFRGVCIGRSTNNIAEYSALIELLSDAITHGIRRLSSG
jgi:ribonuclease HI